MDLKKSKKLKKKYDAFKVEYKKYVGIHVYRSKDKNAPFSEWERITDEPLVPPGLFKDEEAESRREFYYYKFIEVDVHGNEDVPYDAPPQTQTRNGVKTVITPENFIAGMNIYWSLDPDVPLDQWTLQNDTPYREEKFTFTCPVKEPYYMYSIYVNALGEEFGRRSAIERIVPRA